MSAADPREALLARIDPAWAAGAELLTAADASWLIAAHEALERRREQLEAGDSLAILQALLLCCSWSLPAPAWLAKAFTRLQAFTSCEPGAAICDSLDDLFRSPLLPPGKAKRTAKARHDWVTGCHLWREVRMVAGRHCGLDSALEQVLAAGRWSVRKTTARKLVLMVDTCQVHLSSGSILPLSRLWPDSRKEVQPAPRLASMSA